MNPEEMREALEAIAKEKGVDLRQLAEALVVALESAYRSLEGAYEHARVEIDMQTWRPVIYVRESDEYGEPVGEEFDDTPDDDEFGRIAAQAFRQVMTQPRPSSRQHQQIRRIRRAGRRYRHWHHPAERQPLHPAQPRRRGGFAAPCRAGAF